MEEIVINVIEQGVQEVVINLLDEPPTVVINVFENVAAVVFDDTPKQTGVDSGYLGQMAVTNDWIYICVLPGPTGVAVWKRFALYYT